MITYCNLMVNETHRNLYVVCCPRSSRLTLEIIIKGSHLLLQDLLQDLIFIWIVETSDLTKPLCLNRFRLNKLLTGVGTY